MLLSVVGPYLVYHVLTPSHIPQATIFAVAATLPLARTGYTWMRSRHVDGIALVSVVTLVAAFVAYFVSGDPRVFLIKGSVVTVLFGLACLGSLLAPRPLIFYFAREYVSGGDPVRAATFDAGWEYPVFRRSQRITTAVWGTAFLLEPVLRLMLFSRLSRADFLTFSPLLMPLVTGALLYFTISYGQSVRRQIVRGRRLNEVPGVSAPPT